MRWTSSGPSARRSVRMPAYIAASGTSSQTPLAPWAGVARAMIAKPRMLLADEPTGNLDQASGARVIELMFNMARQQGAAVIFVTHDPGLAARADRVLTMTQGELAEDSAGPV